MIVRKRFAFLGIACALASACGEILDLSVPSDAGGADAANDDANTANDDANTTNDDANTASDAANTASDAAANDAGDAANDGAANDATATCELPFKVDATIGPPWMQRNECGGALSIRAGGCLELECPAGAAGDTFNVINTDFVRSEPEVTFAFDVQLPAPPVRHTFAQIVAIFSLDGAPGNLAFELADDGRIELHDRGRDLVSFRFPLADAGTHHIVVRLTKANEVKTQILVTSDGESYAFDAAITGTNVNLQLGPYASYASLSAAVANCYSQVRRCP